MVLVQVASGFLNLVLVDSLLEIGALFTGELEVTKHFASFEPLQNPPLPE